MRIDMLTTFPEMFATQSPAALGVSIPGRAVDSGHVEIHATDIRAHSTNRHKKTDDRPFGGGPGMVMMCQPLVDAVEAVEKMDPRAAVRVLLTPQGERLAQPRVEWFARQPRILLIAGHYEGIDERAVQEMAPLEVSVGDFVMSGGEIPAMALVDAVTRLLPGALGHEQSAAEDSFSRRDEEGRSLLDCPHYTRPREWRGREVPEVLLGGDHAAIERWRHDRMVERTRERRPDLMERPLGGIPRPTSQTADGGQAQDAPG